MATARGAAPGGRLWFIDWLRIAAFALLVPYHVAMIYVPWDFHVKHQPTYEALQPLMRLTNPWRMSLLFVVSGVALGLVLGRPGLVRSRSSRLLWPLLFGIAVVVPPQAWLEVRQRFGYEGGYLEFLRLYFTGRNAGFCDAGNCLVLPTWNHLWFLPYLWLAMLAALAVWRWVPRTALRRAGDALAGLPAWAWLLLPMLGFGAWRALALPHFPETHALVDDVWALPHYAAMFAAGLLLARRPALFARLEALRWPALALAVSAWAALVAAGAPVGPWRMGVVVQQWGAIVAAIGFAHRHWQHDHPWRAPLTEAVFPLYVVHQTIVIVGFAALQPLGWPAGVEAALLVALAFGGGFAAWRIARRLPWLRRPMGIAPFRAPAPPSAPPARWP